MQYLLQCKHCKTHYIGKAETALNIRLNNHRKDVKDPKAIRVDKHFNQIGNNFKLHAKVIIIEQLQDIEKSSNEILKERLKREETFWMKKIKDNNTIRAQSRVKLNPRNAVYIVQV